MEASELDVLGPVDYLVVESRPTRRQPQRVGIPGSPETAGEFDAIKANAPA